MDKQVPKEGDAKFKIDVLYGTVEIVQTVRPENNGWLVFGGYAIHRDPNGVEVSRTGATDHGRIGG